MDWMTLLQNVGIFGVGSGVLTFLIRSIILNSLNKDIEAFKSNLQLVTIEHQVRFSKLHNKRAQVIQTLYEKLVALDFAIHSVLKPFQRVGEPSLEENINEYKRLHNELNKFYLPNKIFLGKDTCNVLDAFILLSRDSYVDITTYPLDTGSPEYANNRRDILEEREQYWNKVRHVFDTDIKNLKEKLENQFRDMLGVKEAD